MKRVCLSLAFLILAVAPVAAESKADVPALIKKLKDKDAAVRLAAARSLAKIGPAAKAAIPALKQALKDEDPDVRAQAKKSLTTIRAGGSRPGRHPGGGVSTWPTSWRG
jgi:HEAT repeat protein